MGRHFWHFLWNKILVLLAKHELKTLNLWPLGNSCTSDMPSCWTSSMCLEEETSSLLILTPCHHSQDYQIQIFLIIFKHKSGYFLLKLEIGKNKPVPLSTAQAKRSSNQPQATSWTKPARSFISLPTMISRWHKQESHGLFSLWFRESVFLISCSQYPLVN